MKITANIGKLLMVLILSFLSLNYLPVYAKYGKYYRDSFYIGADSYYRQNWLTSIVLAGMDDRDEEFHTHNSLMISPDYRNTHLEKTNKSKLKKINKLKKDKAKIASKGEDPSEIDSQIKDLESKLIKAKDWDQSNDVTFVTYKLKGSLGNFFSSSPLSKDINFIDFRIISTDGKVHCKPITKRIFHANIDDQKYLEDVYDAVLNNYDKQIMVYSYDPKCLLDSKATVKHYIYSREDKKEKFYFDPFKNKYARVLKADFNL